MSEPPSETDLRIIDVLFELVADISAVAGAVGALQAAWVHHTADREQTKVIEDIDRSLESLSKYLDNDKLSEKLRILVNGLAGETKSK